MFDVNDFLGALTGWFLGIVKDFLLGVIELLFSGPPSLLD